MSRATPNNLRLIPAEAVSRAVAGMCIEANRALPPDVLEAIRQAAHDESMPQAKVILGQLLQNAELVERKGLPLCQDTGLAVFFVEIGEKVVVENLRQAIEQGVRQGYAEGFLRKSVCHPLTRQNTGDNTPAVIYFEPVPGADLKISFMAKGGGSENMSGVFMLAPAQGWAGVRAVVLERVIQAGANPCPPIIIGLGLGGNLEQAAILSKKALLRQLDDRNQDEDLAVREGELLEAVNALGLGPMALGGDTTCLGVKIEAQPCHIASLPVGLTIQCHSARHARVVL